MSKTHMLSQAQEYMAESDVDGWLLYDYRGMNPFFAQVMGRLSMVTRPVFLFVPANGGAVLLTHHVDGGRFSGLDERIVEYTGRDSLLMSLGEVLKGSRRVAMEYSPMGALPRVSRVDAGTLDLVRSLGVEVVSSADLVQYATQRWSDAQLQSHRRAAEKLSLIAAEAFEFMGQRLSDTPSEVDVARFILRRFEEEGLETPDGPVVAVDEHSSDPHYLPTEESAFAIRPGSWVLIDMWAREASQDAIFADITWVGYAGDEAPRLHQEVFDVVIGARDAALDFLGDALRRGDAVQGWEVDRVARQHISSRGYGDYFTHRLGHSLGLEVHGDAVNLDGWETHDTRLLIPHIGVTIEPGVYLPEFGMRSEVDVYISATGPEVTSSVQREVVIIG